VLSETVVLLSGGLDSAVLLAHELRERIVQPVYVSTGLAWEVDERSMVERLLATPLFAAGVRPVVQLEVSLRDVYLTSHWAIVGTPPAYDTPDEDVYLHGRNVILLSKAAIFCTTRQISRVALAPLAGNPFPDATPDFFEAMARALSLGLNYPIEIATPFAAMHKADVVKLGVELGVPFNFTLSCMSPVNSRHCGRCSKCRERHDAFREAGLADRTSYVNQPSQSMGSDPIT
jgi:7-cyano-7-deazaguanine synthase